MLVAPLTSSAVFFISTPFANCSALLSRFLNESNLCTYLDYRFNKLVAIPCERAATGVQSFFPITDPRIARFLKVFGVEHELLCSSRTISFFENEPSSLFSFGPVLICFTLPDIFADSVVPTSTNASFNSNFIEEPTLFLAMFVSVDDVRFSSNSGTASIHNVLHTDVIIEKTCKMKKIIFYESCLHW